ncbi:hypothetical protein [Cohnella sp.]|uniref:hypothetical protein n=1 Tax=Cohnella sp. TaxID=1883426 RepID=UPI00356374E3
MKRYLLSMALGVFAVGSIGAYYASGTEGDAPRYKLVTLEGDAGEAAKMRLSGSYIGGVGSKALELTVDGTNYQLTQSFYEKYLKDNRYLTSRYEDMKALKREHRDFMRARSNVDSFYKDSEWLIYADIFLYGPRGVYDWRTELKMDVLEEATGRVNEIRIELNVAKQVSWLRVEDVQRIGDEVHVLSQVRYRTGPTADGPSAVEFRDYIVDLHTGELLREAALVSEELAVSDSAGPGGALAAQSVTSEISLSAISSEVRSQPSEYVVLATSKSEQSVNEDGKEMKQTRRFAVFSYRTGKLTPLPEPSPGLSAYSNIQSELSGELFTILYSDRGSLAIARYNVATGAQEQGELTLTAEQFGGQSIHSVSLAQNRVYVLLTTVSSNKTRISDGRQLAAVVLDAGSGELLYKGEAAYDGPAEKADEFRKNLWLTNVNADRP